jgi:hypothetical protein
LACSLALSHSHQSGYGFLLYASQGGTSVVGYEPRSTVDMCWTTWADVGLPTHLHVEGNGPTNSPSQHHGGSRCLSAVMPTSRRHTLSFALVTTLVNISAPLSSVCIFSSCNCFELSTFRIQW